MPPRTALWKVGPKPEAVLESSLAKEQLLEEMIVSCPRLLSEEWMIIGQQEDTGTGGRVDLLALAPDGSLIIIELKKDRTPRDVVAQAIDYAVWVQDLKAEEIVAIYGRLKPGSSLSDDFRNRFGQPLDEESLNQNHQIIIVASSLDDSTERIVSYLTERDIAINVLCFQVFSHGQEQFLSRTWLLDPVRTQVSAFASSGQSEPWNGEFYCSFGDDESRSWDEAVQYGFICAGGGPWYSRTLQLLNKGDRIWVKVPGIGFVGVGQVAGRVQPASAFKLQTPQGELPVLDVLGKGSYHREFLQDPARCEYFVPVKWLDTVPRSEAFYEIGHFGNQNTVCQPTTFAPSVSPFQPQEWAHFSRTGQDCLYFLKPLALRRLTRGFFLCRYRLLGISPIHFKVRILMLSTKETIFIVGRTGTILKRNLFWGSAVHGFLSLCDFAGTVPVSIRDSIVSSRKRTLLPSFTYSSSRRCCFILTVDSFQPVILATSFTVSSCIRFLPSAFKGDIPPQRCTGERFLWKT